MNAQMGLIECIVQRSLMQKLLMFNNYALNVARPCFFWGGSFTVSPA